MTLAFQAILLASYLWLIDNVHLPGTGNETMASVNSRFAEVTQRDILRMQDNAIPNNTKKGIKVCKGKQCFDTQFAHMSSVFCPHSLSQS